MTADDDRTREDPPGATPVAGSDDATGPGAGSGIDRRTLLGAATAGLASGAGCLDLLGGGSGGDGGNGDDGDDDGDDPTGTTTATTATTTATTPPPAERIGTVRYGVLTPTTGPFAVLAEGQRRGAELAVEWIDENDDRFDFAAEATYADTEADPSTGVEVARAAIENDDANYLVGALSSAVTLALTTVAGDREVVYNPGGMAPSVTGERCNRYVFRAATNLAQNVRGFAGWTLENLGTDVWFHVADYAYGNAVLAECRRRMGAAREFEEVGVSRAPLGTENFRPYVERMMDSGADVVVVGAAGADLVTFLRQADDAGLGAEADVVTTLGTQTAIRNGVGRAGYGVYGGTRYVPALETGDNRTFVSRFRDAFDADPGTYARAAFDSVRMTAHGIREAGTADPTAVADVLPGLEVPSVFGPTRFRECDRQAVNPVWVGKNVEPDSGETPAVDLLARREGSAVVRPCDDTGCVL